MNARGQLWSLDVVLAAVIFTLALGIVLSQSELRLYYSQQETQSLGLWNASIFISNMLASKPDVMIFQSTNTENIRCGPNFDWSGANPVSWTVDNELSWLENCLIDVSADLDPDAIGVPPGYSFSFSGNVYNGATYDVLELNTPSIPSPPPVISQFSFSRKMLFFPQHEGAAQYRQCLDGGCSDYVTDLNITVWSVAP